MSMASRILRTLCLAILLMFGGAQGAAAQSAEAVVAEAARAMGIEGMTSIKMWGSGASYQVGQNNNANGPWPRTNLNDFNRWIDFTQPATRATATTWAVPVTGGAAAQGPFNHYAGPANLAWGQHLEIWTTPWGFLKGAQANGATVETRTLEGAEFRVVTWSPPQKSPGGQSYKVVGYIGPDDLVHAVETWVENPIFGDLRVETTFADWRDLDGLKFPSTITQKRAGWPTFEAQLLGVQANPGDIAQRAVAPPPPNFPAPPAPAPGAAPPPASEQLAPGVWRIRGAYNALAVEFADHVVLFEPGPQNEDRAKAIIAETRRVIPGRPIRYGVISHHHFDHTGGLSAVVAEGITIVTPKVNERFLEGALSAPRTLAPDAIAASGRQPDVEGFDGDLRVFEDATRRFEIHAIKGLPHADGLVVGYLPTERILVYADMFNLPPPANPVPDPPVFGTQVFLANIERLGLNPERIMSIHSLNPDRLTSVADIRASLGR
jgi:glyoxylase-like metal-dependent hydrolase (beta-lactamase superfamily II)